MIEVAVIGLEAAAPGGLPPRPRIRRRLPAAGNGDLAAPAGAAPATSGAAR